MLRCVVLDDYQAVARDCADWSRCGDDVDVSFLHEHLDSEERIIDALSTAQIVVLMRERTRLSRRIIEALPSLRLIVTTGMRNASIDLGTAARQGITVCGTQFATHPTTELVFAHLLEFCRKIGVENARLKAGQAWQNTMGLDLSGKTLGVIGLGRQGKLVTRIASAFDMTVLAWSQNLKPDDCAGTGAVYATKRELLQRSDFVTLHVQLSDRTRGLIAADDLALMMPSAFLINTSRGPVIDTVALVKALSDDVIAGAGLDVFDEEPLPLDHPLRRLPTAQLSPHLGYVTENNYRLGFGQAVEDIAGFLNGHPVRTIAP